MSDLDKDQKHWLAILIALTLGVALLILIIRKVTEE